MTTIVVRLDDLKAALLRERAAQYGLEPGELVSASIEDLLGQPEGDFDRAVKRVLEKNKELYRRLA